MRRALNTCCLKYALIFFKNLHRRILTLLILILGRFARGNEQFDQRHALPTSEPPLQQRCDVESMLFYPGGIANSRHEYGGRQFTNDSCVCEESKSFRRLSLF